jgi:hypothetical protein
MQPGYRRDYGEGCQCRSFPEASFVTGTDLAVDGSYLAG